MANVTLAGPEIVLPSGPVARPEKLTKRGTIVCSAACADDITCCALTTEQSRAPARNGASKYPTDLIGNSSFEFRFDCVSNSDSIAFVWGDDRRISCGAVFYSECECRAGSRVRDCVFKLVLCQSARV